MLDLMRFRLDDRRLPTPRMPMMGRITVTELKADIVKWAFVYSLLPSGGLSEEAPLIDFQQAAAIGAVR